MLSMVMPFALCQAEELGNDTRELKGLIDDSESVIFINLDRYACMHARTHAHTCVHRHTVTHRSNFDIVSMYIHPLLWW